VVAGKSIFLYMAKRAAYQPIGTQPAVVKQFPAQLKALLPDYW
jgi:hypothetical protein